MQVAKAFLWLFLLMSFFVIGVPILHSFGYPIRQTAVAVVQIVSLIVLTLAWWRYKLASPRIPRTNSFSAHLALLGVAMMVMLFVGLARHNDVFRMAQELWVLGIMFLGLCMGRYDQVWKDLEKPMLLYFYVGLGLILIGLARPAAMTPLLDPESVSDRAGDTLAYEIRGFVFFWPVLFASAYVLKKWTVSKLLGLLTPLICIVLEIFSFKFRSIILLVLIQVGLMVLVVPFVQKRLQLGRLLLVAAGLLIAYFAMRGTEEFTSFIQRFEQEDKWAFRRAEATAVLQQMSGLDLVIGKGAAGWYWPPFEFQSALPRMETHVGVLQPLLKGGVFFASVFFLFFLRLLFPKTAEWKSNPINVVAVGILPVFLLFLMVNPFPTELTHLYGLAGALAAARLATPAPALQEYGLEGVPAGIAGSMVGSYSYSQGRAY